MLLASGISLTLLVALFFAFWGFFGRFPDQWEWAGFVVGGVGVVMGTPPVFQMMWGRPLVKTQLERGVEGTNRFLTVYLKNPPVRNPILKRLGVRRETVQSLTAQFRISEAGNGKIIIPTRQAKIYSDDDRTDEGSYRIALPPTFSVAASIVVVLWDTQKGKAFVPPCRQQQPHCLEPGYYSAHLILLVDGEPMHIRRNFVVGNEADALTWTPSPVGGDYQAS